MFTFYVIVAALTIVANAGIAAADYAGAKSVLANSAEVGLKASWIPWLATLKMAGALGLLVGLLGLWHLDVAASAGLVLFYVGAVAVHVKARVFYNISFPGFYLVLAVASFVLSLTAR
ncbi:DoxX family protein [Streptomyces sp. NPDC006510]|uniref:DoxX family protein n=1 Tax=Streptomyces sp. NPDC006510 TaxID=3155600 RepID=UPI0033AEC046